jgi:hypothetical protein
VNVLLGIVLLSERLNRAQWTAVALAAAGVAYLTFVTGHPPWISLTLALSFSTYGLIRKVVKVEALPGLATETLLLVPCAGAYLLWCEAAGSGALGHSAPAIDALLIASGPLTACWLFMFAYGARRSTLHRACSSPAGCLRFTSHSSARMRPDSRSSGRRSSFTPVTVCGARAEQAAPARPYFLAQEISCLVGVPTA